MVSLVRVRYVAAARAARGQTIASINGSFRVTFADEAVPGGVRELGAARILRAKPETTSSVLLFNIATDDPRGV
jgi:hypothetical protein